jgi:hypothetical protein
MTGVGAVIGSFMKEPEDAGPNDAFYYGTSAIEGLAAGAMLVVISNAMYVRCIIASQPTRIDSLPRATGYQKPSDKEEVSPASLYCAGTNSTPFTTRRSAHCHRQNARFLAALFLELSDKW